jgi:hypothetical protein
VSFSLLNLVCQLLQITTTVQEKVAEEEEAKEVVVVVIRVVRFCREAPPPPLALPLREREREREMIYCHSCRDLVVYTDLLPLRRHLLLLLLPSTSVCILHHMIL